MLNSKKFLENKWFKTRQRFTDHFFFLNIKYYRNSLLTDRFTDRFN